MEKYLHFHLLCSCVLSFCLSTYTHNSVVLKQICFNYTMSFTLCPLCTSTGLHDHIWDVSFDDAVLGVEVHHGEWLALSGNTT